MLIGYARVSTDDQSLDLQIDALKEAGCSKIFTDHGVSGIAPERDGLGEALAALEHGDTLIVWRLDRLARSMNELTDTVRMLHDRKIGFRSICEYIDISSARGVRFGRRPALDGERFREALYLRQQGMTVPAIAADIGVGRSTMYRYFGELDRLQNLTLNCRSDEKSQSII
jgi:DNA invertase Pin-like site-specific DNA recombinase